MFDTSCNERPSGIVQMLSDKHHVLVKLLRSKCQVEHGHLICAGVIWIKVF